MNENRMVYLKGRGASVKACVILVRISLKVSMVILDVNLLSFPNIPTLMLRAGRYRMCTFPWDVGDDRVDLNFQLWALGGGN